MRGAFFLRCDRSLAADLQPGLRLEFQLGQTRRSLKVRTRSGTGDELRLCVEGVEDRDAAAALTGATVRALRSDLSPPREGEFFDTDLIGLRAVTTDGEVLGTITEIIETGANDVYVVAGDHGEILVPAVEHAVLEVDLAAGRMTVDPESVQHSEPTQPPEPVDSR